MCKAENMSSEPTLEEPVVGIVLVTHADYGAALLRAAEFILGPLTDCTSVSVDGTLQVGETIDRLKEAVRKLDKGKGVIVLTDMFGGTPTNLSLSLLSSADIEVVTGINLPMLLKVFSSRTMELQNLALEAKESGGNGIVVAGEVLRRKARGK
jgi:PTS system mannose-specific IIA component